jgi:hypothetical protein
MTDLSCPKCRGVNVLKVARIGRFNYHRCFDCFYSFALADSGYGRETDRTVEALVKEFGLEKES